MEKGPPGKDTHVTSLSEEVFQNEIIEAKMVRATVKKEEGHSRQEAVGGNTPLPSTALATKNDYTALNVAIKVPRKDLLRVAHTRSRSVAFA